MKKIISLLITFITILSFTNFNVFAEDNYSITLSQNVSDVGIIKSNLSEADYGDKIVITSELQTGFMIDSIRLTWTENGAKKEIHLPSNDEGKWEFDMPKSDVKVFAKIMKDWRPTEKIEVAFEEKFYRYGEVFLNKYNVMYGDELTINIVPDKGYAVEYLYINDVLQTPDTIKDNKSRIYHYTVDSKKVVLSVKFRKADSTLYDVIIETRKGCTAFADKKEASPGDTVKITVKPEEGKNNKTVTVNSKEIYGENNIYTFTMPERRAIIDVICTAEVKDTSPTWEKVLGNWKLKSYDGKYLTGWQKVKNTWYFLNNSGDMKTGWVKVNSEWYYLKSSGAMATGWVYVNNKWYYLYSSGKMAYSTTIDGYKLASDGALIK